MTASSCGTAWISQWFHRNHHFSMDCLWSPQTVKLQLPRTHHMWPLTLRAPHRLPHLSPVPQSLVSNLLSLRSSQQRTTCIDWTCKLNYPNRQQESWKRRMEGKAHIDPSKGNHAGLQFMNKNTWVWNVLSHHCEFTIENGLLKVMKFTLVIVKWKCLLKRKKRVSFFHVRGLTGLGDVLPLCCLGQTAADVHSDWSYLSDECPAFPGVSTEPVWWLLQCWGVLLLRCWVSKTDW